MDKDSLPQSPFEHDDVKSPESQLIGGPIQEHPAKVAKANPITYVTKDDPPFLIVHGDQDRLVPWQQSKYLFEAMQAKAIESISIAAQAIAGWLPKISNAAFEAKLAIENCPNRFERTRVDVNQQLQQLTPNQFLASTPWQWLEQYPRYLEAISYRLDKRSSTPREKDDDAMTELDDYWQQYETLKAAQDAQAIVDPELETLRWMIEEFRVSLFAQKLGTVVKVSPTRLDKQLAKVRRV